jgi:hypothetical protein
VSENFVLNSVMNCEPVIRDQWCLYSKRADMALAHAGRAGRAAPIKSPKEGKLWEAIGAPFFIR